ncbi:MAG: HU family DNA-binding protein [Treponemataceae bacterium]
MTKLNELPERVQKHLQSMTESSGLPRTDASLELITRNWFEKRDMFESQTRLLGMERTDGFSAEEKRGVILLTYSGSLLAVGPAAGNGGRWFEYASIKLRNDVPPLVRETDVSIEGSIEPDKPARFGRCSIKHSSDILLMAVCPADLPRAEEEKRLREASVFLTNGFVKINRTLTMSKDEVGHFTLKNIVQYVARKNDVTQVLARQIIDDYLSTVEAGALLGERVTLGSIGTLKLGARAAQKARLGRNPATGEELLIPAKPETSVPKLVFSGRMKERAACVPPGPETEEGDEA